MQVTICYGNQNLGSYDLEQFHKEVVSFGRQPDNDIVLNYDFVSRVHGVFYKENGIWYVQDLNSSNGLMNNSKLLKNQELQVGDILTIDSKRKEYIQIVVQETTDSVNDESMLRSKMYKLIWKVAILLLLMGGVLGVVRYRSKNADRQSSDQSNIEGTEGEDSVASLPDTEEEQNGGEAEADHYLKVKSEYYDSNDEYTGKWIYEYDSNYNLSSINSYTKDDQLEASEIYEYDLDGNTTCEKSCTYYSGETEETDTIYIYENNKMVKYYDQKIGGEDVGYHVLEYGDSPYAIKETYYDSMGNTNSWNEYEYDDNGNNIKDIYWVEDGKQGYRLCSETTKKYEKNQLIETEENVYDKDGTVYENERQTYEYDEYGNVIENVIYKNGELSRSFKWQYIYNEFGLIETRSYYVDDKLSWVEKNEYSLK